MRALLVLLFMYGRDQGKNIYTCPVKIGLQWGEKRDSGVSMKQRKTTNPRSSSFLRTYVKTKNHYQQTVLVENNNAGATISTRDRWSFLFF